MLTGNLVNLLAKSHNKINAEFIGLDISPEMIKHAKKVCKLKNLKIFEADLFKFKFKNRIYLFHFTQFNLLIRPTTNYY